MLLQRGMLLSRGAGAAALQQPRRVGAISERSGGYTGGFRRCLTTNRTAAAAAAAKATGSLGDAPTSPHVSLVQGASRGIGLEMVRQLLERPDASLVGRPAAGGGHVGKGTPPLASDWLHGPYRLSSGPDWLPSIGAFDHTPC
jgi:hypothetical protein